MPRSSVWSVRFLFFTLSTCLCFDLQLRSQPELIPIRMFDVPTQDAHPWGLISQILRSPSGTYYILDCEHSLVQVRDSTLTFVREIGGKGSAEGRFLPPLFFALGKAGRLYVLDNGNRRIQIFDRKGEFVRTVPISVHGRGLSIAVDNEENFYVLFPRLSRLVTKFDRRGKVLTQFGEPIEKEKKKFGRNVGYLVYDGASNKLILAFKCAPIIKVFNANGNLAQEMRVQSKIVQEIDASESTCKTGEIGEMVFFNVYVSDLAVIDRSIWAILSRGTKTEPALYACDLKGKKIIELPVLDPGGNPVKHIMSGSIDQLGNCAFVTNKNKVILSHINDIPKGGVQ